MSECTSAIASARIRVAHPDSPVAIFKTGNPKKPYDVVFANTVAAQARMRSQEPKLIGVFAGPDGKHRFLRKVTRGKPSA
jgi:hypothetical protein